MSTSTETRFGEADFAELIRVELSKSFPTYRIDKGAPLLYKLHVDGARRICPENYRAPTRGQLAFETDLLISDSNVPLVAIELKLGHFTTHDVLTYSTKATKHKEVFPYLRYGFVVGGLKKIQNRFFTHNSGFDFAFMFSDPRTGIPKLIDIVNRQIKIAERIKAIGETEISSFETFVEFN